MPNTNPTYFDLQPVDLSNELVKLKPITPADFEILYAIASDPLLWQQHPNKDRYKREVFETFFEGALQSKGAFVVIDTKTNAVIGSSRFYDVDEQDRSVAIGYTFIAREYWGKGYNHALKALMLNHAFKYVDKVYFHVGAVNIRSQKSLEKIGAIKVGEVEMEYYGEAKKLNFIYEIKKQNWSK